jgi:hypothetical protein
MVECQTIFIPKKQLIDLSTLESIMDSTYFVGCNEYDTKQQETPTHLFIIP